MIIIFIFIYNLCTFISLSGSFRWTDERNNLFLREVMVIGPYRYKVGSNDAGKKWTEVATKLNSYSHFKSNPRDQRSVREHFSKLMSDFKKKISKEVAGSGGNPEPLTANEQMLEEIAEIMNSEPLEKSESSSKKEQQEKKRMDALHTRDQAMKTWSKSKASDTGDDDDVSTDEESVPQPTVKRRKRRGGSDALSYLAKKTESETALRKQELEIRKEELRLQSEQQKEQAKLQQEQLKLMFDIVKRLSN